MADYNAKTWVENQTKLGPAEFNPIEQGLDDASKHHKSGTLAARPAASAANKNWTYYATDAGVLYCNFDGATWTRVTADGGLGEVADFMVFGDKLPTGWLPADGRAVSRTTYAALFAQMTRSYSMASSPANGVTQITVLGSGNSGVASPADQYLLAGLYVSGRNITAGTFIQSVGTPNANGDVVVTLSVATSGGLSQVSPGTITVSPWGLGDMSTTFNLPDLRGRGTIGAGQGSGLTNRGVGQTGGEETHQLTTGELPAHSHGEQQGRNFLVDGAGGVAFVSGANYNVANATANTGSNQRHNTMQPFGVATKAVKVY